MPVRTGVADPSNCFEPKTIVPSSLDSDPSAVAFVFHAVRLLLVRVT